MKDQGSFPLPSPRLASNSSVTNKHNLDEPKNIEFNNKNSIKKFKEWKKDTDSSMNFKKTNV